MKLIGPYRHILENAKEKPKHPAVVCGGQSLTFSELKSLVSQIASEMRRRGLKPGQVAIVSTGKPLYDYVFGLAVMHEAAVVAPRMSKTYNPSLAADIAFVQAEFDGFPVEKTVIIDGGFMSSAQSGERYEPIDYEIENPIIRLLETSGTTGQSKVIEYDFDSMSALADDITFLTPTKTLATFTMEIFAGVSNCYDGIRKGTTYFLTTRNVQANNRMIVDYELRSLKTSPATLSRMLSEKSGQQALKNLYSIVSVGAALPQSLVQRIRQYSNARIFNRYGASECGALVFSEKNLTDEAGLVGKPFDWVELRIFDENLMPLEVGQIGKIGVKSRYMRNGYRNNPDATERNFRNGYFFSGDEGYVDSEGRLFLVGRSDERINSGGVKVDPTLIDGEIWQLESVKDAAVFGFDQASGLRGLAVVVALEPGASLESVKSDVRSILGTRSPMAFIEVAEVPKNEMGKVQRIELENLFAEKARELAG